MPPYFGNVRPTHDPVDESLSCRPGFIVVHKINNISEVRRASFSVWTTDDNATSSHDAQEETGGVARDIEQAPFKPMLPM